MLALKSIFSFSRLIRRFNPQVFRSLSLSAFFVSFSIYNNYSSPYFRCEESISIKSEIPDLNIKWEEFSDNLFEQALSEKSEIIIFVNSNSFIDSFKKDVETYLVQLNQISTQIKKNSKKKLRFFKLNPSTKEELNDFEKKYGVKIGRDTLLLLKNKYVNSLISFKIPQFFQNKEYLFSYFSKLKKLKSSNYIEFLDSIKNLPKESVVLLCNAPTTSNDYEVLKKKFAMLSLESNFQGVNTIYFLLIKDEKVSENLKLNESNPGDIFLLQRQSKLNYSKSNFENEGKKFQLTKSGNLKKSKLIDVINELSQTYNQNNVFTNKGFEPSIPVSYTFIIEMDSNRLEKSSYNRAVSLVSDVHKELIEKKPELEKRISFVKINKKLDKQSIQILLREDQRMFETLIEKDLKSMEEIQNLYKNRSIPDLNEPNSFVFSFPNKEKLTKENILDFIDKATKGEIPQFYKSQTAPKYRKFSKKIVGKTFKKEIIDNDKSQAVFFYSKHCHACKRYGQFFENYALENIISKNENIEYNRLNSDNNEINCVRKFHYTPVFLLFKKDFKKRPCVYLSDKMTPDLLKNFVEVSSEYELIDEKIFDSIIGRKKE